MYPVTAQKKAVMQGGGLAEIIQLHIRLNAQSAGEVMYVRPLAHMVTGELYQPSRAHAVGAAVASVQDMRHASPQYYSSEGGAHAFQRLVAMTLGVDPAIQRGDNGGSGALNRHGFRHVAKFVQ